MYLTDSSHVWHVAKSGNDGNSGHAGQYPVNLANDAKLTVGAAITAASAGDTIIVWPGTYNETVTVSKSLNIFGTDPNLCEINALVINSPSYIEQIIVDSSANNACVIGSSDVTVYRCRFITTGIDGVIFGASKKRVRIIECYIKSGYDGLQVGTGEDVLIERGVLESTGASGSVVYARGFTTQNCKGVIVRDCLILATTTQGVPVYAANAEGQVSFFNCIFKASASVRTGEKEVVGLNTKGNRVFCVNGNFDVNKGGAFNYMIRAEFGTCTAIDCAGVFEQPPAFGLNSLTGSCTAQVSGQEKSQFKDSVLSYMEDDLLIGYRITWTSGNNAGESKFVTDWVQAETKYIFGSNFTNDIEVGDEYTAVFYSYTAHEMKIARVTALHGTIGDGVTQLDEQSVNAALEGAKLDKAAKVLVNKAVQNKATGAVQYYDDDGQTVILTHTPSDGESEIMRAPS